MDNMLPYVELASKDDCKFAIQQYKSFMIVYYQACNSSNSIDYFNAARLAKQLEYCLRKLSFWQKIKFMWFLHHDKESTYKGEG